LLALIAIPTIAALGLTVLRIDSSMKNEAADSRTETLAELTGDLNTLAYDLAYERDLTVAYIAAGRPPAMLANVQAHYAQVNSDVAGIRTVGSKITPQYGAEADQEATIVLERLNDLTALRGFSTSGGKPGAQVPGPVVINHYADLISGLLAFDGVVAQGVADDQISQDARSVSSLAAAVEQASQQRAIVDLALYQGRLDPTDIDSLISARSSQLSDEDSFKAAGTLAQVTAYNTTVAGPQIDAAKAIEQRVYVQATTIGRINLTPEGINPQIWMTDMGAYVGGDHAVVDQFDQALVVRSAALKSSAQRSAIIDSVLVLAVLLLVLLATVLVARSLVGPLRRLRSGAMDVAESRLPALVRRMREPDVAGMTLDVEAIDVDSTDEIGEVARAFDEVHREAVRLAANEAMLRGNINAMFVNLSRRSQSLIERQLHLIDDLEQGEQDADRLESLFRLDHLATRMRRNGENLLVLGGHDQARRWNKPVPLVDVVRASLSEVEQYDRVGVRVQSGVSVAGQVVNDLVHLVAELVENATNFSPEHTRVAVSGHLLSGGGAMLQISDNGLGMSADELEEANWRLANPPVVDVSVSRRMGLFVVGRLAQRHGIRVELRAALSGGLTAFVLLPAQAILQADEPRRLDDRSAISAEPVGVGHMNGPRPPAIASWDTMERTRMDVPQQRPPAGPPAPFREPFGSGPQTPMPAPIPEAPMMPPLDRTGPQPVVRADGRTGPQPTIGADDWTGPQVVGPDSDRTGPQPLPRRGPGSQEDQRPPGAPSPIFDRMQSEWFHRSTTRGEVPLSNWRSASDAGWEAAEAAAREPASNGNTSTGLPKRVPGQNRVPGTASAAQQTAPPPPPPSADAVRGRFSSFQQGVRKGRANAQGGDERDRP
jgi:signal transduction histidine kinase